MTTMTDATTISIATDAIHARGCAHGKRSVGDCLSCVAECLVISQELQAALDDAPTATEQMCRHLAGNMARDLAAEAQTA